MPVRLFPWRMFTLLGRATNVPAEVKAEEFITLSVIFCQLLPESVETYRYPLEASTAEIRVPSLETDKLLKPIPANRVTSVQVLPEFVEMSMCP